MDPAEEAKENVGDFLLSAQAIWYRRTDAALRRIANLRWWEVWKAPDIASQALGIGKYWNQEEAK